MGSSIRNHLPAQVRNSLVWINIQINDYFCWRSGPLDKAKETSLQEDGSRVEYQSHVIKLSISL